MIEGTLTEAESALDREKGHEGAASAILREVPMRSRSLWSSFGHALAGLGYVLGTQRNARIHMIIGALALVAAIALSLSWSEIAIIGLTIALVFFAELVNTVTETVVDLITIEHHPLAKTAKDIAAGAVLWTAVGAVAVGILIIGPHLMRLFK